MRTLALAITAAYALPAALRDVIIPTAQGKVTVPAAPEKIAAHLRDFWEPRMREQLTAFVGSGGQGLKPSAEAAARLL